MKKKLLKELLGIETVLCRTDNTAITCKPSHPVGSYERALKGGSYSHFPAQILTKSHRPTAQIPSSLCLSCSNLNPIPIFYCFFVDESQSQCIKSHFPSQKMGKSQFPFYPFRTLLRGKLLGSMSHLILCCR